MLIEPVAFPTLKSRSLYRHINVLTLFGDHIQQNALWTSMQQKSFDYIKSLRALGTTAELIALPEIGVYGNSHMPMMDKNNDKVLDIILKFMGNSK